MKAATILCVSLVTLAGCGVDGGHLYFSKPDRAFVAAAKPLLHDAAALYRQAPFAGIGARDSLLAAQQLLAQMPQPESHSLMPLDAALRQAVLAAEMVHIADLKRRQYEMVYGQDLGPNSFLPSLRAELVRDLDGMVIDYFALCVWEKRTLGTSTVFDEALASLPSVRYRGRTVPPRRALSEANDEVTARGRPLHWWARP